MVINRSLFTPKNRDDYLEFGVPLYEASLNGDWETAKLILDKRLELVRFGLCRQLGTALHIAVWTDETKLTLQFVTNLVNMMTAKELELQNNFSNTAFWIASAVGNVNLATVMLEKNPSLQHIRGVNGLLPLSISASGGKHETVKYLYDSSQKMTGNHWTGEDRETVLMECVKRELFDGGSGHIAETVRAMKKSKPEIMAECLTSDFQGDLEAVSMLANSGLDIFAHNIETVNASREIYEQSLSVLKHAKLTKEHQDFYNVGAWRN
ncbi:ankyrin repeat-containing domain-containing protein [Artemisia annua]|uniref:Ankyrin repeat-containing domain-containing protein n=1 Tax=Artemisia annua TaxID=35608 RepID=A0A2U1PPC8_ARTAN|nr:ankyrin repeat-containing domain-containing protein [Artemisia annua]